MGICCATIRAPNREAIEPLIKTGDVILFRGGRLLSTIVQAGSNSRWTHVGIAVRYDDGVYVMHSTPNPGHIKDRDDDKEDSDREGVMMTKLEDELTSGYYRDCGWRQLKTQLSPEQDEALMKKYNELRGTPYENDYSEMLKATAGMKFQTDLSSLFCSEFLVTAYIAAGLLPASTTGSVTPADVSGEGEGSFENQMNQKLLAVRHIKIPAEVRESACSVFCNCSG